MLNYENNYQQNILYDLFSMHYHAIFGKILAIIPSPSYSHQVSYRSLWTVLSRWGYKLVVLIIDPVNDLSIINLTEIDFHYNYRLMKKANHVKNDRAWYMAKCGT